MPQSAYRSSSQSPEASYAGDPISRGPIESMSAWDSAHTCEPSPMPSAHIRSITGSSVGNVWARASGADAPVASAAPATIKSFFMVSVLR